MVTVASRKPPPDVLNPEVKSLNYMNSVMPNGRRGYAAQTKVWS